MYQNEKTTTKSMETSDTRMGKPRIRWMTGDDLNGAFHVEETANARPWNASEFAQTLYLPNCVGRVAVIRGQIVGYILFQATRSGVRVWRLAVLPEFQRRGIASQLVAQVAFQLAELPQSRLQVHVRESNLASQLFFRSMGFRAVAIQRHFFEDTQEDAYTMEYRHQARTSVRVSKAA